MEETNKEPDVFGVSSYEAHLINGVTHEAKNPMLGIVNNLSRFIPKVDPIFSERLNQIPEIKRTVDLIDLTLIYVHPTGKIDFKSTNFNEINYATSITELRNFAEKEGFSAGVSFEQENLEFMKREVLMFLVSQKAKQLHNENLEKIITAGEFHSLEDAENYMKGIVQILKEELPIFSETIRGEFKKADSNLLKTDLEITYEGAIESRKILDESLDYLNFSRMSDTEVSAKKRDIKVVEALQPTVNINAALARVNPDPTSNEPTEYKDINISVYPSDLLIKTHPIMKKVWYNLVYNAVKFGETVVNIHAFEVDGKLLVVVADDGRGIPDNLKEKIFEPGVQGENAPKSTGLGLSMCKDITERVGGVIGVDSEEKRGTAFFTLLPLDPNQELTDADVTEELLNKVKKFRADITELPEE